MPDIFNRTTNSIGKVWSVDGASVTFAGPGSGALGVGMLVQQVNVQYRQQVTRIYEIGSDLTYFIAGRIQGNMTIGQIIGPGVIMSQFYRTFGNPCNAPNNVMQLNIGSTCTGAAFAKTASYLLSYLILTDVGLSVGAQDMVINEQLQLMFVKMEQAGGEASIAAVARAA